MARSSTDKSCRGQSSQDPHLKQDPQSPNSSYSASDNFPPSSTDNQESEDHSYWSQFETPSLRSASENMGSSFSKEDSNEATGFKASHQNGSWDQASDEAAPVKSMKQIELPKAKPFHADNSANTLHHPGMSIATMRSMYEMLRGQHLIILPPYSTKVASMHNIALAHANDKYPFYWTKFRNDNLLAGAYESLFDNCHGDLLLSTNKYRLNTYGSVIDLQRHRICRKCASMASFHSPR